MLSLDGGTVLSFSAIDFDPLIIGDYKVPIGASIQCSRQKIISKTQIEGAQGTIKQMSGFSDWNIIIEFQYVAGISGFVLRELKALKKIWEVEKEQKVLHSKLKALGITHIVIEKIELPDNKTNHDLPAILHCLSDNEVDLANISAEKSTSKNILGALT